VADDTRAGAPKLPKKQSEARGLITDRHCECSPKPLAVEGFGHRMLFKRNHCVSGEGPHLKQDRQNADTSL
jgi:hypothetical protein